MADEISMALDERSRKGRLSDYVDVLRKEIHLLAQGLSQAIMYAAMSWLALCVERASSRWRSRSISS